MARLFAAVLAPTVTIISTLLALGVITPFERGKAEALADSQASTLDAGTAKIRIDVGKPSATTVDYTAVGAYDFREGRGRFVYNFTNLQGRERDAAVEARFFQNVVFVHRPTAPRKARWLLINVDRDLDLQEDAEKLRPGTSAPAIKVAEAKVVDPTTVLQDMAETGAVRDRGESRSLGAKLHKYSGALPAARGDEKVTATAWIDDADLIRRLDLSLAGGGSTTRMVFYDFGVKVDAAPPPADQVALLSDEIFEGGPLP